MRRTWGVLPCLVDAVCHAGRNLTEVSLILRITHAAGSTRRALIREILEGAMA